ncbi:hypothetical protein [Methanosarcina siciliae]|nr:hypothetical protein [Methanosarcina siciliae]
MVLYKIKFIELNGSEETVTESFLSQKDYRKLLKRYKDLKGLR